MSIKQFIFLSAACLIFACNEQPAELFVEAENFTDKGGWVVDQQFMGQMGSPYLMAHEIGKPVDDATTLVEFPETGTYHVHVHTYNWTSPWVKGDGPGRFQLKIDDRCDTDFFQATAVEHDHSAKI